MTNPHIPDGYDTAEAFLDEARKRFQEGVDADRDNREAALDDLRFVAGDQWDETVKAGRLKKGRPCLSINTLPQYIGQVIGDMRMNRPAIKVRPAEGGDVDTATVRQGLIRSIEAQSNASQVYALAGEDQVACGIGHFRVSLAYAADDSFDQDIRIEHVPNPFGVVWDAASVEPTGADAEFCFVVDEIDKKAFGRAYPDAVTTELTTPTEQPGWIGRDAVRVTQYWLMKEETRKLALVLRPPATQPSIEDVTGREDEVAAFIVKGPNGAPRVRDKITRSAVMYLITGREILEGPYPYPIQRLPVFKVTGREVRVGERRYRFGLVRFAKDAVRMKNLWRSSAAEWLALAPRQQWLLHAADKDEANRYRNAHKSGDTVLTYSGQIAPQRLDPPTAPNALLQEAQINDQDIKDATGLHDASLGMRSNETSGKAILARERQGDVATYAYHDNLQAAVREAGRVINALIPIVYDSARTLVVLGEDDTAVTRRVNDPSAQGGHIDLKTGKYDVVIETGPSFSTRRVEAAESMMAFVQAVPGAAAVAGDLIAKAQDWPMASEIAERMKRVLPPQVLAGEGPQPDPRAAAAMQRQQAAQMQAQQAAQAEAQAMAREKALLELREQAAKTMLAEARAAAAQAG
jgi:hypothetical protein